MYVKTQDLQILHLNDQPILTLNTNPCRIQVGNFRIIHEIDLKDLEKTVHLLTDVVYNKINNPLSNIVKNKIKSLHSNYNQIRPGNHRYARSIDIIGSVWKWIGGSPDAQDLHIINNTMNTLIENNNIQYRVNQQLGQRIKTLTNEVRKLIEDKQTNELIIDEIDTLTTIINIETINKILEEIQEAITLSKVSVTSNKMLSTREIYMIKRILEDQGVVINLPDEAITYVTPKIAANDETLLYILLVPELQKEEAKVIQLFSLNNNNSTINNYPKYLVKNKDVLYTTTQPNEYVQKDSFITRFTDECILPIIMGTSSHCTTRPEYSTAADFIADNLLLINNARGQEMTSSCGPDNRSLHGNFLITFSNCSVTFINETFTANETTTKASLMYGATYNIKTNRSLLENDLESLDTRTLINRKHIQHVYLQQAQHDIWNWSLLGGITISTLITITLVLFALLYFSHIVQGLASKFSRRKKPKNPTKETEAPVPKVLDA